MSKLNNLYQEVILDHNRNPKNFKKLDDANRKVKGYNPLCGDHYTIYVKIEDDIIKDITFQGAGCAISKASASVMSTVVKGKTKKEVEKIFDIFHKLVTTGLESVDKSDSLGKLEVFAGVSGFPARVKCAILAWHALKAALESEDEIVSTE